MDCIINTSGFDLRQGQGDVDATPYRAEWAREILALRIIQVARQGERDVRVLRDDGAMSAAAPGTVPCASLGSITTDSTPRALSARAITLENGSGPSVPS